MSSNSLYWDRPYFCQQLQPCGLQRVVSYIPINHTINRPLTTMAASIDNLPNIVLTIGSRNSAASRIFVVYGENETQIRRRGVLAVLLDIVSVVVSCYIVTSLFERSLGFVMVAPMLAGVETGGRRRRAQSRRGN